MSEIERVLESVRRFLERDDLEVDYREEKEYGFKKERSSVGCITHKRGQKPRWFGFEGFNNGNLL